MNLAEYRRRSHEPRGLPALGGARGAGRRPQQGRLLPAHGAVSRSRSRLRHAGRARRHHRAAQQRAAASRLRLGDLRRGAAASRQPLSGEPVSRSGLRPRRRRAPGAVRGRRRAFREPVFPDPGLAAAGRRCRARRELALRGPRARRRRLARRACRLRRPHRPRAGADRGLHARGRMARATPTR